MEQLSLLNIPALPTGLTAEVRIHDKDAPGTGALATIYQIDEVTEITQPGLTVSAGGRLEAKAAADLYDIKLGGGAGSPDTAWNGGAALWIYGAGLGGETGGVTSVAGTSPIVSSGGTNPAISIPAATNSTPGHATASHVSAIEANTAKISYTDAAKVAAYPSIPEVPLGEYLSDDGTFKPIAVGSGSYTANLYLSNVASDTAGYKKLSYIPDVAEVTKTIIANASTVQGEKYLFDAPINVTAINSGVWINTFTHKISNNKELSTFQIRAFMYTLGGVENDLFTVASADIEDVDFATVSEKVTKAQFSCNPTDRFGIQISFTVAKAEAITLSYLVGDGSAAYILTPLALRHSSLRSPNEVAEVQHMTAAEKVVLGNTSGANTGDQDLSGYALISSLGTAAAADTEDFATAAQGALADSALQSETSHADVLVDGDIGVTVAAALGADDNYVTDAEKIVIGNTSGTNTGDNPGVTSVTGTAPIVSSGGTTPAISMAAATNAINGYATAAHITAIEANTAKNTNVPTSLSVGTVTATTVAITSDGGADDVTIPAATTSAAGLLTATLFDEIAANTAKATNATHTGEVTGDTTLTIATNVVTNTKLADVATATIKGRATAGTGDPEDLTATQVRTLLNVADGAEANRALASQAEAEAGTDNVNGMTPLRTKQAIDALGGGITSVTGTAPVVSSGGATPAISMPAATNSTAGHATAAHIQAIEANTAKETNATHTGDVTGDAALTITANAITNAKLADVATGTIKGRVTAGTGDPEDLTATQVRTLLNVADGAEANRALASQAEAEAGTDNVNGMTPLRTKQAIDALGGAGGGGKNKIINGNFDIWQRGTSQTSSGYGSDDRWVNTNTGSTKTHSRQTFALGQTDVSGNPKYYSRTVVTSVAGAGNFVAAEQRKEYVSALAGQTATLSFYAKANANKNIAIELLQYFGSGGTPSATVTGIGAQLVALTTSWQKFEITVDIPSIAGKILGTGLDDFLKVQFWFDAGSNYNTRTASLGQQSGTFDIAQVQLEEGSVATEFEQRHLGQELALCQWYFRKSYDMNTVPGAASVLLGAYAHHAVHVTTTQMQNLIKFDRMRAIPTITIYSPDTGASGKVYNASTTEDVTVNSITFASERGATFVVLSSGPSVGNYLYAHYTADAEL